MCSLEATKQLAALQKDRFFRETLEFPAVMDAILRSYETCVKYAEPNCVPVPDSTNRPGPRQAVPCFSGFSKSNCVPVMIRMLPMLPSIRVIPSIRSGRCFASFWPSAYPTSPSNRFPPIRPRPFTGVPRGRHRTRRRGTTSPPRSVPRNARRGSPRGTAKTACGR